MKKLKIIKVTVIYLLLHKEESFFQNAYRHHPLELLIARLQLGVLLLHFLVFYRKLVHEFLLQKLKEDCFKTLLAGKKNCTYIDVRDELD